MRYIYDIWYIYGSDKLRYYYDNDIVTTSILLRQRYCYDIDIITTSILLRHRYYYDIDIVTTSVYCTGVQYYKGVVLINTKILLLQQ